MNPQHKPKPNGTSSIGTAGAYERRKQRQKEYRQNWEELRPALLAKVSKLAEAAGGHDFMIDVQQAAALIDSTPDSIRVQLSCGRFPVAPVRTTSKRKLAFRYSDVMKLIS